MTFLLGTLKVVASDFTPSDTTQKSQPWINEYMLSANYNDIARYRDYDNRGGFGLGMYHNSRISKGLSTNIGLEYNLTRMYGDRSINHQSTFGGRYSQMNYRWHTMTLPLSLRYHVGKRWIVFPELGVHANMNMLLTQHGEFYTIPQFGPQDDNSQTTNYHSSNRIRPFSIGAHAGIGIRIPLKENHLMVKAEYRYGFDKDHNYNKYATTFDGVLNYFRFSAGYSFGLRPSSQKK